MQAWDEKGYWGRTHEVFYQALIIIIRSRLKAKHMADQYVREGNTQMAQRKYAESIDITPQISY